MKNIIFLLSFLFVGIGYAQERNNNNQRENRNDRKERPNYYEVIDTTSYTLDKQEYIFTPTENGVNISRVEDDGQISIGDLRRTTTDGYYIMTSTPENQSSFGRFDRQGNFRSYRYDPESDAVIEEDFMIQDPVERRDQNRRNNRGKNENRKNNRNNNNQ